MNSMELSNYLEKMRYGRKLTQEDFVADVVSLRQYQRYRRGECEIPYEKIDQFAHKLGIPSKKLMNQFESEKNRQLKMVNDFYNAVSNRNKPTIKKLKKILDEDILIDKETKTYYEYAVLFDEYYNGIHDKPAFARKISNLINYPDILKQEYFTDIEILILSSLLIVLSPLQIDTLLRRLSELFNQEDNILSSQNNQITSLIIMRLSKGFGMRGDYSKVIEFTTKGIKHGIAQKQYHLFEYFYYYKALAHFKLEEYLEYEEALFRCYNVLHLEGNKNRIEQFTQLIEKDFDINYHMFIMKYLKKEIM